jgi:hypothetical protein
MKEIRMDIQNEASSLIPELFKGVKKSDEVILRPNNPNKRVKVSIWIDANTCVTLECNSFGVEIDEIDASKERGVNRLIHMSSYEMLDKMNNIGVYVKSYNTSRIVHEKEK